jgi:prepilin-type N-terminal cleavage/methylation domain-containing protein
MKKDILTKNSGFTLIEMMIVMAIIGILSATGFMGYQSAKRNAALRAAQREVATVIRLAQGYALQGKTQGDITPCGYGFKFTANNTYQIFYTNKLVATKSCSDSGNDGYPGTEILVGSAFVLDNDVAITNSPASNVKVYFHIPFAPVTDLNDSTTVFPLVINFNAAGETVSLTINSAGEIIEK